MRFAVWAPNALNVTVAGEFNDWDIRRHPMRWRNGGVWELFIPGLGEGAAYKYHVRSQFARIPAVQGRSVRVLLRDAAEIGVGGVEPRTSTSGTTRQWMEARGNKEWLKSPVCGLRSALSGCVDAGV